MVDAPNQVDVSTPTDCVSEMVNMTLLPRTLMGGTHAMRKAQERYLPRFEMESADSYQHRLYRTVLFNAFAKTVCDMTGKVFDKAVVLKDNVPEQIQEWCENIDLTGRNINVFARDVFEDLQIAGVGYVLVDMPPKVERPDGQPATVADEQAAALRPYCVYIPMENMLGWKSQRVNGQESLIQVRFLETVEEPDGEFHEVKVTQIRVLEPGSWRIFRKVAADGANKTATWELYSSGTTSLNKITLVPIYAKRTGFMIGKPPHEDLAHLNVAHWQSSSDQRNILTVTRCPILYWAGKQDDDKVVVGANSLVSSSDYNSKLSYTEITGGAADAGDKDLQNLQAQMQAHGLLMLVDTPGAKTATGERRDDVKENSPLAMMAVQLGDGLEHCLAFMAEYGGIELDPEAGKGAGEVVVNTDFGIQADGGSGDLQWLVTAATAGDISRQTLWFELQRRNILSATFDAEAEKELIAGELEEKAPQLLGAPMQLGAKPPQLPAPP